MSYEGLSNTKDQFHVPQDNNDDSGSAPGQVVNDGEEGLSNTEQQFHIQPVPNPPNTDNVNLANPVYKDHPEYTNATQNRGGNINQEQFGRATGGSAGPQVLSTEQASNLDQPKSREELHKLSEQWNKD